MPCDFRRQPWGWASVQGLTRASELRVELRYSLERSRIFPAAPETAMRIVFCLMIVALSTSALGQSCMSYGNVTNCLSADRSDNAGTRRDRGVTRRFGNAVISDSGRSFYPFGNPAALSNGSSCVRYGSVVTCN
jgi:hypothetical protein